LGPLKFIKRAVFLLIGISAKCGRFTTMTIQGVLMLLHFTQELSTLESILQSSAFNIGYCTDNFGVEDKKIPSAAHPIVSFSEYKDVDLVYQNITYGGYAVGLSKNWAVSKGLSPVSYIERHSQAAIGISSLLAARQTSEEDATSKALRLSIMQVQCFVKHETGHNSKVEDDEFCFKNENEWRYVPTKKQIGGHYISLDQSSFIKDKAKYNNRLLPYPLTFSSSDIVVIYVQSKIQKAHLIRKFPNLRHIIKFAKWTKAA
jgi:hypothetical protein